MYSLRTYHEGDEREIVKLFNNEYRDYAGFVPRTIQYWRWSCLDRPDVDPDGIIVAVDEESIVGYAVVGRSGNIWELCFDSTCDVKQVASLILTRAVEYLASLGADMVNLNVPSEDFVTRQICKDLGLVEMSPERMFLGALDFPSFLTSLFNDKKGELASFNESILITLEDAPSWIDQNVLIELRNGEMKIRTGTAPHEAYVKTKLVTLMSILFGDTKSFNALLSFKLKIHPFWKIASVLKLLSRLRTEDHRFFPLADFG